MNIILLTNEYPPHLYGGAGVHVEFLSKELARLDEGRCHIQLLCFGEQRTALDNMTVEGIGPPANYPFQDARHQKLLETLYRNIGMTGSAGEADIVHCHTWYTLLAGCLIKRLYGIPLVITTHSLEPQRPWKEEQLGSAYRVSAWIEKTSYENADGVIAVSNAMRAAVRGLYRVPDERISVIHNGIDLNQYKRVCDPSILKTYGIDPLKPYLLFVGRVTRQKGILHLVNAIRWLDPDIQVVLCAGAPDTEAIAREMSEKVREARSETKNRILWIDQWVPRDRLICLYSGASVFVCSSVYEPFGIIALEAMACGVPVVASAVGGLLEVVVPGETGELVPFEPAGPGNPEPGDPDRFSRDMASAVNDLLRSPGKMKAMAAKSRERVEKHFSWESIARKTLAFYRAVATDRKPADRR